LLSVGATDLVKFVFKYLRILSVFTREIDLELSNDLREVSPWSVWCTDSVLLRECLEFAEVLNLEADRVAGSYLVF